MLVLDDLRHSYVDLDDPRHLEFDYTRWIGDALDAMRPAGRPLDALFVGGGGFTLPRYVAATRPGSRSRVLEVDPQLVDLARERLGPARPARRCAVRTGDARVTLRDEPDDSADVVVGDAFGGRTIPWHLATAEFVADVRRVLRPGRALPAQRDRPRRARAAARRGGDAAAASSPTSRWSLGPARTAAVPAAATSC